MLTIEVVTFDDPEVVPLVERQVNGYAAAVGVEPWPLGNAHEYMPPDGVFLLARLAGRPVGCAGLRRQYGDGVGEIKRLWTEPEVRRRGIARALMHALESDWAPRLGYTTLILDTSAHAPDALALYAALGWEPAPRLAEYNFWERSIVLRKALDGAPPPSV